MRYSTLGRTGMNPTIYEQRTVPVAGHLVWTGRRTHDGYAVYGSPTIYIHRWAWEQANGPIPEGHEVDHLCNMPFCVNPAHLEPVTPTENQRRRSERITACKRGHPYTPENTYRQGTARSCKTCRREAGKRWRSEHPS